MEKTNCKVVVGYGPLSQEVKPYANPKVIVYTELDISKYFKGFDLVISAAGYNTYEELLVSKVPTAFFAQEKGMDDQARRVENGVAEEWHYKLDLNGDIESQINYFLNHAEQPEGLKERENPHGAITSSLIMAELYFSKNQDKIISLRLASIALKLIQIQVWKTDHPVKDFLILTRLLSAMPVSMKLDFIMQVTADHENGEEDEIYLSYLNQCTRFNEKVSLQTDEGSIESKRLVTQILKEVKGNLSLLQEWNTSPINPINE